MALKSARIVDLCGKSSGFADFENSADRGWAVIFEADCACLMFGPWVLNEIWITNLSSALIGMLMGRVEKTDPRSADYPLTPSPRTTLWTTPRTTLRTASTDYPKKSTKFLLRSTKIQKAYLLFLHDHNCTKNSRHFLFLYFSTQSFSFCPILHRPATCQNAVSTMDDR